MPEVTFTDEHGAQNIREQYGHSETEGIAVDNNTFSTVIADVENIIIDNRNLASLLIHLFNDGGTNSFDYEISGHAKEVDTPPSLSEPNEDWHVLPDGTGSIANNASDAVSVTDDWAWIAIRLKRTSSGLDSIANVYIRALKAF